MDKNQTGAFSQAEMDVIKRFVKSREDAPVILRNHFLQLPITDEEKTFLRSLSEEEYEVLRKIILPHLRSDVPVTLEATMYSRLLFIAQYSTDGAYTHILVNDLFIDYCKQQFELLRKDIPVEIVLEDLPKPLGVDQVELRVTNMLAFNSIVSLVEERIHRLAVLGTAPEKESDEEKKKKDKMNSTK